MITVKKVSNSEFMVTVEEKVRRQSILLPYIPFLTHRKIVEKAYKDLRK